MATRIQPQTNSLLLRRALYGDALFSGLGGLVCIAAANPLSDLMGVNMPWAMVAVGVFLLGYAGLLWYNASHPALDPNFGLLVVIGNGLWVAASVALLVTNWVPFTLEGKWIVAIVAAIVDVIAVIQFVGWRRMQ